MSYFTHPNIQLEKAQSSIVSYGVDAEIKTQNGITGNGAQAGKV
jgi:hypothetical protein